MQEVDDQSGLVTMTTRTQLSNLAEERLRSLPPFSPTSTKKKGGEEERAKELTVLHVCNVKVCAPSSSRPADICEGFTNGRANVGQDRD